MFNMQLWITIIMISLPGALLMSWKTRKIPLPKTDTTGKVPKEPPSEQMVFWLTLLQTIIIVVICAALGTYFGPKVGLGDPFIEGWLTSGFADWNLFIPQLLYGVLAGIASTILWLIADFKLVRPKMDIDTLRHAEKMRMELGFWTRVIGAGTVEEIMFRWGLFSIMLWGLSFLTGGVTFTSLWVTILLNGVIFGLAHVPGYRVQGSSNKAIYMAAIFGNLWVTLFIGWLFWKYGLTAAIIAHMMFHVIAHPIERIAYLKGNRPINPG